MPLIDTNHQRAALVILLLGIALVIALTPYATGLIGIPVLYAVFAPVHEWLSLRARPKVAASLVVVLALFLIVVPGVSFAGLIVNQAQQITGSVVKNPILGRIAQLELGGVDIGPRIADLGAKIVGWLGSSAFGLIGTATRLALNLTISLFGLFYLLLRPGETWEAVRPYIPFSAKNTEKLRQRFRDVTTSTIIGTGLTAAAQGAILGRRHDGVRYPADRGQRTRLGAGGHRAAHRQPSGPRRAHHPGRPLRGECRLHPATDGVPALGEHSPARHAGRCARRRAVLRDPGTADRAAGAELFLRAREDV